VNVNTDGLSVTFTVSPVDRHRRKGTLPRSPDAQSRLVRGFAQDRCNGKVEVRTRTERLR